MVRYVCIWNVFRPVDLASLVLGNPGEIHGPGHFALSVGWLGLLQVVRYSQSVEGRRVECSRDFRKRERTREQALEDRPDTCNPT